ncbi:peptidoglycan recognition family protein [Kitasatospora sp. NPDC002551]|uniref:peptidoglycan recognition protein family protein n=1 Tax=Kitasatospora sp. NPDC002551 TaxID=3154539 RepID=UPI00331EB090
MAWYPGAQKMELQPESDEQPAITPTQVIFHSVAAPWTPRRMYEYWRDSTNLESHFGVGYNGSVGQFIGTQTRADANFRANRRADGTGAVSVETASNDQHTDAWTDAQLQALIALGLWLHQRHGIPIRACRTPTDPGFGVHRMFPEWSASGTACPGDARARQFRDVVLPGIARAAAGQPTTIPAPAPAPDVPEDDMPTAQEIAEAVWNHQFTNAATGKPLYAGAVLEWMDKVHSDQVATLQAAIAALPAQVWEAQVPQLRADWTPEEGAPSIEAKWLLAGGRISLIEQAAQGVVLQQILAASGIDTAAVQDAVRQAVAAVTQAMADGIDVRVTVPGATTQEG